MSNKPQILIDLECAVKASSFAYQLLSQSIVVPTSQHRWEEDNVTDIHTNWNAVYSMPYKCTSDVKSHYFQYRFIHKILPTNVFLFKIGKVDSDKCTLCKEEKETMKHLMWSCIIVSSFWKEVIKWFNLLNIQIDISYTNVCLGIFDTSQSNFINMILILAKRHIYRCRVQESNLFFQDFKEWVLFMQKVEKQIALNKRKLSAHIKKWEPLL